MLGLKFLELACAFLRVFQGFHALRIMGKYTPSFSPRGLIFFKHVWVGGGGGLLERGALFNLAKRISSSLSTIGNFPIELSFLLCKFLQQCIS